MGWLMPWSKRQLRYTSGGWRGGVANFEKCKTGQTAGFAAFSVAGAGTTSAEMVGQSKCVQYSGLTMRIPALSSCPWPQCSQGGCLFAPHADSCAKLTRPQLMPNMRQFAKPLSSFTFWSNLGLMKEASLATMGHLIQEKQTATLMPLLSSKSIKVQMSSMNPELKCCLGYPKTYLVA